MMPVNESAPSRMVEDYLTLIWKAFEWPGASPSTTELAAMLGVTPSTVSANLKKLARDGWIEYEAYGPVALTARGREVAIQIVRRHRIIETFLVRRLGLSWDQVHDEADRLEHSVSDLVLDRMDADLGHPTEDPHGDPIPVLGVEPRTGASHLLAEVEAGRRVRVIRVADRHADVLRYLSEKSITIGSVIDVVERSDLAGSIVVRRDGELVELTTAAATQIRVAAA